MANTQTFIKKVEFIFDDESTHCNVLYKSSEPDHPVWGGGWKTKTFPKTKNAVQIINEDIKDYLYWNTGRTNSDV